MKNLLLTFLTFLLGLSFVQAQEWNSQAPNTLFAENGQNQVTPIQIGIGTSSPSANLHTVGPLRFQSIAQSTTVNRILGTFANGNVRWISTDNLNSNNWQLTGNTVNNNAFIGTLNNQSFRMRTNNSRRMEVEAGGRVKILANPQSTFPGGRLFNVFTNDNTAYNNATTFDGIYLFNEMADATSAKGVSIRMGARRSGNNNNAWHGTAAISGVISTNNAGNDIDDAMDIVFQNEVASPAVMQENMRITANGNIGIGTDTPTAQLHTTGSVQFDGLPAGTGRYLALNANNQVVVTTCQCAIGTPIGGRDANDEVEDLKKRVAELEALVQQQLGLQREDRVTTATHVLSTAALYQNAPNPFNQSTMIAYDLPEEVNTAKLIITDLKGQTIKEIIIEDRGEGQIELLNEEMENGYYAYSLLVDGRMIDTKKMIVTK